MNFFGLGGNAPVTTMGRIDSSEFESPPPKQDDNKQQQQEETGDDGFKSVEDFAAFLQPEEETDEERAIREAEENGTLGDDGKPLTPKQIAERQTNGLGVQIQNILKAIAPAAEDFGEDFDPNDPSKLGAAMAKLSQRSAAASVQASVVAIQQVMGDFEKRFDKKMLDVQESLQNGSRDSSVLDKYLPEAKDPIMGSFVMGLFKQAKAKAKNPEDAAKKVRAGLDHMGLGKGKQQDPSRGDGRNTPPKANDLSNYFSK